MHRRWAVIIAALLGAGLCSQGVLASEPSSSYTQLLEASPAAVRSAPPIGRASSLTKIPASNDLPLPTAASLHKNPGGAVLLQGFHWTSHRTKPWWGVISSMAGEIGTAGFDFVWLPPPSEALSDEGYLPSRWFVLDSQYGTETELRSAVRALRLNGVGAVGDIVLNHRVGTKDWADFTDPQWGPEAVCSDDEWPGARGNPDSGKGYHAGRDLDHSSPQVQQSVYQWMSWLKDDIGFSGWRFDYARGFHAGYMSSYSAATSPDFAVAEIWDNLDVGDPNAHRQALCDWMDEGGGAVAVFDFTTKGMLQHAVYTGEYWRLRDREGKPSGLIGWWPANAVTFIDNHDTGPSPGGGQNHWPFPSSEIMQGYAYILTHPGVPTVYWPHFFDWGFGDQIKTLIAVRKSAGIHSESNVEIAAAERGLYAAFIDEKLAMKIGSKDWSPGEGWTLAAYGRNYAVWTR